MKKIMSIVVSLFISTAASAATWNVDRVISGVDGGFGFSSLHDASGSNVMSGSVLTNVTGASGTYNDVTGAANFTFLLSNGDSLGLQGNLFFNNAGWLSTNSSLAYTGLNTLTGIASSGSFGYMAGDVCCSGQYDPNSFMPTPFNLNYLTLWGADGFDTNTGTYANSSIGMDFRLELTPSAVPLPAAVWMFAPVMGFLGLRKKKVSTTA